MCSQIQDLLHSIPAPSARATSQVEESATCATAVLAGCIRSVLISKMLDSTKGRKIGHARPAVPPLLHHPHNHLQLQQRPASPWMTAFNANGIGNKLSELERFLEKHNVKVAAIQESKLTSKSRNPRIKNFTTVRRDRPQGQGGGLLIFIHKSINFHQQLQSQETLSDLHLEELTISAKLGNTELIISNIYIPPTSSCTAGYQPSIDHLMTTPDTLILGDFNTHHSSWHATSTDTRGKNLAYSICNSDFGILNWDTPTRLPSNTTPSSPDVSLASSSLITSTNWNTITTLASDHLPILIRLQTSVSVTPASHRTYVNLKKANWASFTQEIEDKLSNRLLPSDCQKDEKTLRAGGPNGRSLHAAVPAMSL